MKNLILCLMNMDWDVFQEQKEWLMQQCTDEEDDMASGILHMMDEIEDAWEADQNLEQPWAEEAWYMEDIVDALMELDLPVTPENIEKAKIATAGLFSDKSNRQEQLKQCIEEALC